MRTETPLAGPVAAFVCLALLAGACDRGGAGGSGAADCGLPTPDPRVRADLMPEPFLLEGDAEIATSRPRKGGVLGVLNLHTLSVQDAFPRYKRAVEQAGFDLVGEDNEGFEAEMYMKRGKTLGSLQIRTSVCRNAAIVFVNIVKGDFALPISTTPRPTASP